MAKERGAKTIPELDEALDFENIVVDDGTPIGKRMTKASLKALLTIEGTEMEPLVGGTTSGTALVVPNGPAGVQRTAEVSSGKWYDFGSGPVEASAGRRWKSYWSGTAWSLKDMGELPTQPANGIAEIGNPNPTSGNEVAIKTLLKKDVDLVSFKAYENIAEYFDLNDPDQFGVGIIGTTGAPNTTVTGWKYSRQFFKMPAGNYITNLFLTQYSILGVYNDNGTLSHYYHTKGVEAGTTFWNFTVGKNQSIKLSHADYMANNFSITSSVDVSWSNDKVFLSAASGIKKDELGVRSYPANYNIGIEFDFSNTSQFGNGIIDTNGNARTDVANWKYLKDFFLLPEGTYTTNLFLSPLAYLVVYNADHTVANKYSGKGVEAGTVTWTFVVGKGQYIRFSKADYQTSSITITSPVDVSAAEDKVFVTPGSPKFNEYLTKKKGKILVWLGDSMIEFLDIPYQVGLITGFTTFNCGIGGTRMSQHPSDYYKDLSFFKIAEAINTGVWTTVNAALDALIAAAQTADPAKATRLTNCKNSLNTMDWSTVDVLMVSFGTNDFNASTLLPIGSISLSNMDTVTVTGALNYGIDKILSKYPKIKIMTSAPIFRYMGNAGSPNDNTTDSDYYTNFSGYKMADLAQGIVDMSNLRHLPSKNMYKESMLSKYSHSIYYSDKTHVNFEGAKVMAKVLAGFINEKYLG